MLEELLPAHPLVTRLRAELAELEASAVSQ